MYREEFSKCRNCGGTVFHNMYTDEDQYGNHSSEWKHVRYNDAKKCKDAEPDKLHEAIKVLQTDGRVSIRVFKSILTTMRKSKELRSTGLI